jgi:hypothetical protein
MERLFIVFILGAFLTLLTEYYACHYMLCPIYFSIILFLPSISYVPSFEHLYQLYHYYATNRDIQPSPMFHCAYDPFLNC